MAAEPAEPAEVNDCWFAGHYENGVEYCMTPALLDCMYCALHELLYRAEHGGRGTSFALKDQAGYLHDLNQWERDYAKKQRTLRL